MTDAAPRALLSPLFETMPAELRAYDQWVLWRAVARGDKTTKVPYQANGRPADVTNPDHWCSFDRALAVQSNGYDGVGFVLTAADPFVAVDLDHCVDDRGIPVEWALGVISELDTYTEWSPSGEGVRIIACGSVELDGNRRGQVEVYTQERYVTITGRLMYDDQNTEVAERTDALQSFQHRMFGDRPSNVVPLRRQDSIPTRTDEEVLALATNQAHFEALAEGDDSAFSGDASQGDHVFCKILARCTGDDDQVDRLYRQSGRYRDKWDSRRGGSTYGSNTIVQARLSVLHEAPTDSVVPVGVDGFEYNDVGNGLRLLRSNPNRLRWVDRWKCWMVYDQGVWVRDPNRTRVEGMASRIADPLLEHLGPMRHDSTKMKGFMSWYQRTKSTTGMADTVKAARTMSEAFAYDGQFEAHPWLLNTLGRTIDLETGYARDPDPADLLMRRATVVFDPSARFDEWSTFLERIIPDRDVRDYVQMLAGLTLIGEPQELLPILWGEGANGKSTLTEVMAGILGDYAVKVSHDVLVAQKGQTHPTSLASLFGARFAHSGELDQGARLNESLVKELTGGDTITARRMYEDFWEFRPSHLMWLHSNYRPQIRGMDTGIWRRVKLIPFEVQIPAAERVNGLKYRLLGDEGPGILNWMLRGLAEYRRNGYTLPEPPAVLEATAEYRQETDTVSQFINDSGLVFGPDHWLRSAVLDMMHAQWYASHPARYSVDGHAKMVKVELRKRGCDILQRRYEGKATQGWAGVGLTPATLDI
jgi:putative DNA primase/helicase